MTSNFVVEAATSRTLESQAKQNDLRWRDWTVKDQEWEANKDVIKSLYLDQNLTLRTVMETMK
jgi:hypothetical protein